VTKRHYYVKRMGIKHLNRFLRANCQANIRQVSLSEFRNKTVAVDASIYLFRFQADQSLIEGMYQMVGLFRHHGVRPLFVFDGKPPPEKDEVLRRRREEKRAAERLYKEATRRLRECDADEDTADLEAEIDQLRRKFVRVTGDDIERVKTLLRLMGAAYYESPGESDGICVRLVQRKIAHACLSEDMDMFAYGCPRVLRYLSLLRGTVVQYELDGIVRTLGISKTDFRRICILAGTDYNTGNGQHVDLNRAVKMYSKFSRDTSTNDFYDWIQTNNGSVDMESLRHCEEMFDTTQYHISRDLLTHTNYDMVELRSYLREYGFVFA